MRTRLYITVPLLLVGRLLSQIDFDIVWRYFSWSNQTLAMIALWAGAVYLCRNQKNFWIAAVPATFMSAVSATYILMAEEGLRLPVAFAYPAGVIFAAACAVVFYFKAVRPPQALRPEKM